jgi:hypothetical protein
MTLLDTVKTAVRTGSNIFDEGEIVPLIEAAKKELKIAGVAEINETDPLIIRFCVVYAKAHFGYDNPEAEKFERIANSLKNALTQIGEYNGLGGGENG